MKEEDLKNVTGGNQYINENPNITEDEKNTKFDPQGLEIPTIDPIDIDFPEDITIKPIDPNKNN